MDRPADSAAAIPRSGRFDQTPAFLREGYGFVSRRCNALGTDIFRTRLMLRPVICMRGAEAARIFYDGDRFTRQGGAMPPTVLRLLQDKGSVQQLDGAAHRHRKAMFTGILMGDAAEADLLTLFREEWDNALTDWTQAPRVELLDAAYGVLTRAVCRWAGMPCGDPQMQEDLSSMVERTGRIGPGVLVALARRRRAERRVRDLVEACRDGRLRLPATAPLAVVAGHRDTEGRPLSAEAAAVEMLNLLRPVAAVARYVMFAAMALEERPEQAAVLGGAGADTYRRFAEEVRRRYPFFPVIGGIVRTGFDWRGHRFRAGDWVLLDLYGTTHDPRLFPDPEAFDPGRDLDWRRFGHDFIPQGAGDPHLTHRCPGERLTVALVAEATRLLVEEMRYEIPPQDLSLPLGRMPARPAEGLVLTHVRRR